ncbi:MAG: sensor histidine kinase [Dyadobacter sp.]|uniref:sensor histidine kinase n=1 Tax=Dyadobacter sp. TaxID=1914288 RepID=UPI001AFFB4AD|nr:sensor histidine kinase [Dyadobacter sp.]MBO9616963.1 sensor histidine kinase [Dyadobacter sp.]
MIEPTKEAWQPILERKLPVLLHLLGWGIYATLVFYGNFARMSPGSFFLHYGLAFAMHAGSFYLNYLYLVPSSLPKYSIARFLAANLLAAVLMASCVILLEGRLAPGNHMIRRILGGDLLPLMTRISNYIVFAVLGLFIRLSVDWYGKLRKEKEAENEHLKSELALLKGQINPHFLFNSLNNLYALSLRQAPETPTVILRISEMMRYLLYETNAGSVPLEKEIDMVRTYVAMNELRSKSGEDSRLEVSGNLQAVMIQPLLLLPLIENVFKHGTSPMKIAIRLDGPVLSIHTENKIRAAGPEDSGGFGIANLQRRLALLYRNAHELTFSQEQDTFVADLTIKLNSQGHD